MPTHETLPSATAARKFRFHQCLGRGGFGEVYRATMTDRGGVRTDVAVKVLHEDVDAASQAVRRLRDEAHLLAALRHPGILKVHDLVTLEGRVALVTEFVDGQDLTGPLRAKPPMPLRALVDVVGQIAGALAAALETPGPAGTPLGLVHRDIKPHNLRIGRHGEVKLLDFGIARGEGIERSARTDTNAVIGSWQYMAPESFGGRASPAGDVFSLGCILYEGLVGSRLVQELDVRELYALSGQPHTLSSRFSLRLAAVPREVAAPVRALLDQMLAIRPEERPTAATVSRACEEVGELLPGASLRRWCRERTWPDPAPRHGEFDGVELVEGAPRRARRAAAAPVEREATGETIERSGGEAVSATRTVALAASGVAGLAVAGALFVVAVVGVIVALWIGLSQRPDEPVAATPPPLERPVVVAPVVPADEPPEEPPVVAAAPAPADPPPPASEVVAPPVVAEPVPPPAPPVTAVTARIRVDERTKVAVRLAAGGGILPLPATVPPGRWTVEADFGSGFVRVAEVQVVGGESLAVWCKSLTRTCEVR